MARIRVAGNELDATIMQTGDLLTLAYASDMTLDALASMYDAAAAPEIRVLAEDGTTASLYQNHAVVRLTVLPGAMRMVQVDMQVEPLAQSIADKLEEQIAAQKQAIVQQTEKIAAQAETMAQQAKQLAEQKQTIAQQDTLLQAASAAARFTVASGADNMTVDQIGACADLFDAWTADRSVTVGDIVSYGGKLYRVIQAHTTQADWSPEKVPALFKELGKGGAAA
ncbi:MAG: hypothetical protein U0J65_05655 [Christensenellales bacterium]|nr:hypothetical protein [Christensenellales bacterium]